MNQKTTYRKSISKHVGVLVICAAALASVTAYAGPFGDRPMMGNPLENLLDHFDLSDDQETQVKAIIDEYRDASPEHMRMGVIKEMISLSPGDTQYLEKTEAIAQQASLKMKAHMINRAKAMKAVYEVLDVEQRQELEALMAKKQKRLERRMHHHAES